LWHDFHFHKEATIMTRRRSRSGNGFLYQKAPGGTWYCQIYDRSGKRVTRSAQTTDRGQAQEFLHRLYLLTSATHAGTLPDLATLPVPSVPSAPLPSGVCHTSFSDFSSRIREWAALYRSASIKESYPRILARLGTYAGRELLQEVRREDIEQYLKRRVGTDHIKCSTANNELKSLCSLFNLAVRWRLLAASPVKGIHYFPQAERQPRFLSLEQVNSLLESAQSDQDTLLMVAVGVFAGLRLSEWLYLEWTDIDFERGLLQVRNKEGFRTKSRRNRTVPICDKLRALLQPRRKDSGYCISLRSVGKFRWRLAKSARQAGLMGVTPHVLRHTFASLLVQAGVSIFKVSRWLGHSDVKTTLIYAHLAPQDADINRIAGEAGS
jgi:integrase